MVGRKRSIQNKQKYNCRDLFECYRAFYISLTPPNVCLCEFEFEFARMSVRTHTHTNIYVCACVCAYVCVCVCVHVARTFLLHSSRAKRANYNLAHRHYDRTDDIGPRRKFTNSIF